MSAEEAVGRAARALRAAERTLSGRRADRLVVISRHWIEIARLAPSGPGEIRPPSPVVAERLSRTLRSSS